MITNVSEAREFYNDPAVDMNRTFESCELKLLEELVLTQTNTDDLVRFMEAMLNGKNPERFYGIVLTAKSQALKNADAGARKEIVARCMSILMLYVDRIREADDATIKEGEDMASECKIAEHTSNSFKIIRSKAPQLCV